MDINGNLNESNEDYEVVNLDDSNDGSDVANPGNLNESNDDYEVVNLDDSNDGSDVANPNDFNDNSGVVNLAERRSKAVEDLEMGCRIWSYCCRLHFKEMEVALSNLHYAYVLRKQKISRARWLEITRLRSIELNQHKKGLVLKFITWMSKLDRRLSEDGIFVESGVKKYMEHPVLGYIPEYNYESVITKVG